MGEEIDVYLLGFKEADDRYLVEWGTRDDSKKSSQNELNVEHQIELSSPGAFYSMRGKWRREYLHRATSRLGFRKVLRLGWSRHYSEPTELFVPRTQAVIKELAVLAKAAQYYATFDPSYKSKKEREKEVNSIMAVQAIPLKLETNRGNEVLILLLLLLLYVCMYYYYYCYYC